MVTYKGITSNEKESEAVYLKLIQYCMSKIFLKENTHTETFFALKACNNLDNSWGAFRPH